MKKKDEANDTKKRGVRGMGRIYRRGDTWWIQYSHQGKRQRESSESSNRRVAVDLLKTRFEDIARGRPPAETARVTLKDLWALVDADYVLNQRASRKRLGEGWGHIMGYYGENEKAIAIGASRLAAYVRRRHLDEGAAPSTVKYELAVLKRAFSLARKSGALLPNEIPAAFPTISPNNVRTGFFEREQHDAVRAALPRDEGDLAEFLFWTGWRESEGRCLLWSNVDEKAQIIRIEATKNGEARTLPYGVLPELVDLINTRRKITEEATRKKHRVVAHVFHRGGGLIPYTSFRRRWIKACVAVGLGEEVKNETGESELRAFRIPHDYRRSAARNLSRAGVPEKVIMQLCGWKTRTVFDRYRIVAERDLSEGLAKLAQVPQSPKKPSKITRIRKRG